MITGDRSMIEGLSASEARMPLAAAEILPMREVCSIDALIGESVAMQILFEQMRRVGPTHACVLIVGENGAGKQRVARCLHELSGRSTHPFITVNCAAVQPGMLEAELFGSEQHDGIDGSQRGYFERAGEGTLLLDDICGMPLDVQVKLLHVLETGRLRHAHGEREIEVNCRVMAATTEDPQQLLTNGKLRADLLYHLAVFPLHVPPLRERDRDAELLAQYFLDLLNAQERTSKHLSRDSNLCLRQYPWPGNVRELRNVVHRAFILADDELELRAVAGQPLSSAAQNDDQLLYIPVGTSIAEAERWMIFATLKKCGGNKTRAAALLGVSLKTLYNRLNAYRAEGLEVGDLDTESAEVES
jgi:two-component system, NtrC family, response regulator AtoC